MKPNQKLDRELARLEQALADSIAHFAHLLEPLPSQRDPNTLNDALGDAASARRKLAQFLKSNLEGKATPLGTDRKARATQDAMAAAQHALRYWVRYEAAMLAQIDPPRCALISAHEGRDTEPDVMDHVVTMFLDVVHNVANPEAHTQSETANKLGFHRDIPYPMSSYSKMLGAAYRVCLAQRKAAPLRFLDVGSGGGSKVLAATTCFDLCDGLEYEENAVETGAALLGWLAPKNCRLIHGDGLTFDGYDQYDVIYYFRPIANTELMTELEDRIVSSAKPGTVLAVASGLAAPEKQAHRVKRLANQIYVVGISEDEAEALRSAAEELGTTVPGYGRRPNADLGYWQPLQDACMRNGYSV